METLWFNYPSFTILLENWIPNLCQTRKMKLFLIMGAINRNSSQVPSDTDTGKDELEIGTQLWRSVLISFHPTKRQCIISIAKIYLKWRNTLFFRGINLILSQYLEAMIDASQGRGEQENHNSALLLGLNCRVLSAKSRDCCCHKINPASQ